jgi:guanine deaminase
MWVLVKPGRLSRGRTGVLLIRMNKPNSKITAPLAEAVGAAVFNEAFSGIKRKDGGPFGAAVVKNGRIIARAHNTVLRDCDATRHAEMNAITKAGARLRSPHLTGCILVASSEPCPMCLAAAYWAGVDEVVYFLPKQVAAKVGFSDAFIYEELAKPPAHRKLKVRRLPAAGREEVFEEWQKREGKLY